MQSWVVEKVTVLPEALCTPPLHPTSIACGVRMSCLNTCCTSFPLSDLEQGNFISISTTVLIFIKGKIIAITAPISHITVYASLLSHV